MLEGANALVEMLLQPSPRGLIVMGMSVAAVAVAALLFFAFHVVRANR